MNRMATHGYYRPETCSACTPPQSVTITTTVSGTSWTVSDERLDEIADGDEYDAEITSMARELRQLRAQAQASMYGEREG